MLLRRGGLLLAFLLSWQALLALGDSDDTPTWYILQLEDIPEEMHSTDYVDRMKKMLSNVDDDCLGQRIAPEIKISVVFEWVCTVLHHMWNAPNRVYEKEKADFIFVPTPPFEHRPEYFRDVMPKLFPLRHQYTHVIMLDAHTLAHIDAWEAAPDVISSFMVIMQQQPAYLFNGMPMHVIIRQENQTCGIWHYNPKDHPTIVRLQQNIISCPFVGQAKFTFGSKRFHEKLDVDELKRRKEITLLGMYNVRNNQREYLYNQCMSVDWCKHNDAAKQGSHQDKLQLVTMYNRTWAALMPQGDEPTRQAIWDCLVMDCIPVFPAPADWMIPYFPYTDIIDYRPLGIYLTHIDRALASEGKVDYMKEFLDQFSVEKAIEQIQQIRNVSHVFQYMQEPWYDAIRFSQLQQVHRYDDAFTMLIKGLLRKMCNRGLLTVKRCGKRWFAPIHNGIVQV